MLLKILNLLILLFQLLNLFSLLILLLIFLRINELVNGNDIFAKVNNINIVPYIGIVNIKPL